MNLLSLDGLIVAAFLLITLVVGLRAGRGIKDIREYAIANKQYGTGVLTMTFLATYIGGSTILAKPAITFSEGCIITLAELGCPIALLLMAFYVAPKVCLFRGSLTMGDVMNDLYGKKAQVLTGLLGFMYALCIVSAQMLTLSGVCKEFLGLGETASLIAGGSFVILYSAAGGMRAVTATDVLQFLALAFLVPLVTGTMLMKVGGPKELFRVVPADKFLVWGHPKFKYYMVGVFLLFVFNSYLISPPFVSRMLMARNKQQAMRVLLYSAAFDPVLKFLLMLIGLCAVVLYPSIKSESILLQTVNKLMTPGLRGLCVAGIMATIMSTADSFLHTAGLSLAHDVVRPFRRSGVDKKELRQMQYFSAGVGALSMVISLKIGTLYAMFSMMLYGMGIMGVSIMVPFLAGVLGLKADAKSFFVALFVAIPVFVGGQLLTPSDVSYLVFPVSLCVNAVVFFGMHWVQNGRFVLREGLQKHAFKTSYRTKSDCSFWEKLMRHAQTRYDQYGASSTLFGLFTTISYMVPVLMHSYADPAFHGWIVGIKGTSVLLCIGLLLKPYWSASIQRYFPLYYYCTLGYCLPFTTTFLFLLGGSQMEWIVNVTLAILLLIVLTDWRTFVMLTISGIALALGVYKIGIGPIHLHLDVDTAYTLVYAIVFSTLIGLLFARRKQQRVEHREQD